MIRLRVVRQAGRIGVIGGHAKQGRAGYGRGQAQATLEAFSMLVNINHTASVLPL